ncbi:MAG TPA: nucleotidyltransferase domain-containing protein [Synergistetes bacterium]|nr:nucleotidyltransferase domain-containing protein [Synergistota bacterium]
MEKKIESILEEYFKNSQIARLAILMGSFAKGTAREKSDVDVAILFGAPCDAEKTIETSETLSLLLKREVDLVVLDDAGPIIKMQALKSGKILYREMGAYEDFFARTLNEYSDLKICRKEAEEKILGRRIYA